LDKLFGNQKVFNLLLTLLAGFLNSGVQEGHQKRRRAQRLTRDKSLAPGRRLDGDRQNRDKRRASQPVFWPNSSASYGLRTPRLRSVNIDVLVMKVIVVWIGAFRVTQL
jgi:hypothetical protein